MDQQVFILVLSFHKKQYRGYLGQHNKSKLFIRTNNQTYRRTHNQK
jgi:hypothetical protein